MNKNFIHWRSRTVVGCLFTAILFLAPLAWGHGIDIFARVEGTTIHGTMNYPDHTPIAGARVTAYAPDGAVIAESQSDVEGRFTFPVTMHCDYRIVGDAGEGHAGSYTVPASELPTAASSKEPVNVDELDARIDRAVARQVAPLREQLFAHERAVRLRDILGGIGYVFGLAGIVILLKHRKAPDS